MELRHLRYFVAVAEELNFTKAAARLHLSQPSLTRQVHNLEEEIGVRLLNRSKHHVSLTEAGRAFFSDANHLLALAAESVHAVQRLSRGETGQLNIGYLPSFQFDLLPRTLAAFRRAIPQISLELVEMNPAEQVRALAARRIDLGFVGLRAAAAKDLVWERVARRHTVVVLPRNHSLTRKRAIGLEELRKIFFVSMSEKTDPGFCDWLCETCQGVGFTPRIVQQVELEPRLISLVAEGFGVTLAPEQFKSFPNVGVAFRPLAPPLKTDYWMAWSRDNNSNALRQYVQIVKGLLVNTRQYRSAARPPSAHVLAPPAGAAIPAPFQSPPRPTRRSTRQ